MADLNSRRRGDTPSRTMADLLFLPELDRSIINWLLKQQRATLAEITAQIEQPSDIMQTRLDDLLAQGFIQAIDQDGITVYQPCLISRKGRQVPNNIWDALT